MFSKNFKCRNAFVNNIDTTTRKKTVHIQKDNDIFNRRSLSCVNIDSSDNNIGNKRYMTEMASNKKMFKSRPDNNLSVEIAKKMYSNNYPSRNNNNNYLNDNNSIYNEQYKNYNTFTTNNNNDNVSDLLSYDKSHDTFYRKNTLNQSLSMTNIDDMPFTNNKHNFTKLKHNHNRNGYHLKHLSINELFESNRKTHLNYNTNINPEIAQYDINEMTNYIKTNNIKDKIARRAALTKRATQALMNAEYASENRSLSLQNKMETSQSNYDKHLLNIAKIKLKQKLLEVNIQQCNMQQVKKNANNALQRREITDYYKMNDKICEKKMNAYKHCTDSIVEDNFKAMKYLAVPNNCYPNRNVKRKNKLPFPVNNNNNSKYKNK
jgi:hypothetical protein